MTRIATVAVLLAAVPGLAAAQQPDHFAVHGLTAFYADADPHLGTGVSWQNHVGRNWALNVEYDFTTTGLTADRHHAHSDHLLWLGVAKSFGPPDRSVPYLVIGGAGIYRHTFADTAGFRHALGVGVGWRRWNDNRRWFIAPEARLLINAHFTASVAFGFRL